VKQFNIGDLVEYKNKLSIITGKKVNIAVGDDYVSYMYQLHDETRWILDHFLREVKDESR
jgi:hypothetical protein